MARVSLRPRAAPKQGGCQARTRPARKKVVYKEGDTDSEDGRGTADDTGIRQKKGSPANSSSARQRMPSHTSLHSSQRKTGKVTNPLKRRKRPRKQGMRNKLTKNDMLPKNGLEVPIQITEKTMPWTTLPYHILLSVFFYASHPLMTTSDCHDTNNIKWLIRAARCCKAFTEPALSVLYYEPPLSTTVQISRLVSLLQEDSFDDRLHTMKYSSKIKYLNMGQMNSYKAMESLIPYTSQLRGFTHALRSDDPKWARALGGPRPKNTRPEFFAWLRNTDIRLETWTWNRTCAEYRPSFSVMQEVHQSTPFQSLRHLSLLDISEFPRILYSGQEMRCEDALADVLKQLPGLRHLQIALSPIVNDYLTPLLPASLESLNLTSCLELRSPAIHKFLIAKGENLRELVLSHNQCMNLSFLIDLASTCPRLEVLKINLLYYNSHHTFQDSNPKYLKLLEDGEQPSWPCKLRFLELLHLRRWTTTIAGRFFTSLTNSAQSLTDLRHIHIKASLDESGWRDRVTFRDIHIPRLKRVFLRKTSPPNPHLSSFAAFRAFRQSQQKSRNFTQEAIALDNSVKSRNDTGHIRQPVYDPSAMETASASDSDIPLIEVRRSARANARKDIDYSNTPPSIVKSTSLPRRPRRRRRRNAEDSSSEDSALDDGDNNDPSRTGHGAVGISLVNEDELNIQGMCDTVEVVIDNLRPMEEQLHEDDFLDDEISGDEDWNGDDRIPGDGYAW